jgi:hypothetical protein
LFEFFELDQPAFSIRTKKVDAEGLVGDLPIWIKVGELLRADDLGLTTSG